MDHIPGISRAPTNGTSVVGKIATTAKMTCFFVLMVGATFCLDRVVHAFSVFDALPTTSPCVDIFHLDLRDSVEQRVRRRSLMNRVDLVQLGGHVTNPEDPYTVVRDRGCKARHVQKDRLAVPTTLALVTRNKKSRPLLAYVADLGRDKHRRGGTC